MGETIGGPPPKEELVYAVWMSLSRISVMAGSSRDPRMALQAASHVKQDQMYPHWKAKISPQKRHPRFRLSTSS